MSIEIFAIGFSDQPLGEEAIKEISLEIKSIILNKPIDLLLIFFTPHYRPINLKENLEITLKPKNIFGIQSPIVIFENKAIKRGIVICCLCGQNLSLRVNMVKNSKEEEIETILRKETIALGKEKDFMFFSLTSSVDTYNYLRAVDLVLGRGGKIFGSGFMRKYGIKNFQIVNEIIDEGGVGLIVSGHSILEFKKIGGFLPIGRTFTLTKVIPKRCILLEIDGKPASSIYREYLEEEFYNFKRLSLGNIYPIGILERGYYKLVNVLDVLEDDSLFCLGELEEGKEAKIMIATPSSLLEEIEKELNHFKNKYRLALVMNCFTRRRLLVEEADKEIEIIKETLGEETKVIGFYSDYHIFPNIYSGKMYIENNNLGVLFINPANP
ncbi:MAG: FIST C-terminal domain-containing protein [Candidatus Omnitrophica bacterium]|nr:FIST C-terminal domain-containing protein [Candidatus Omnitrophota bacterium]